MRAKPFSTTRGYSTIQLLITIAVAMIIAGMAIVGVTRARDHARLMNSAREFAAYIERARGDAVRRHNGAGVQVTDEHTFSVSMDFDGDGTLDTKTFTLQQGVRFTTGVNGVNFDWRGRVPQEESFGFSNGRNTVSVGVTGSGDVTFDAQFFSDALLPPVAYTGAPGGYIPDPSPSPGTGPYPTPPRRPRPRRLKIRVRRRRRPRRPIRHRPRRQRLIRRRPRRRHQVGRRPQRRLRGHVHSLRVRRH